MIRIPDSGSCCISVILGQFEVFFYSLTLAILFQRNKPIFLVIRNERKKAMKFTCLIQLPLIIGNRKPSGATLSGDDQIFLCYPQRFIAEFTQLHPTFNKVFHFGDIVKERSVFLLLLAGIEVQVEVKSFGYIL